MLYCLAFILDHRAKMTCFSNILKLLSYLNGKNYSCYLTEVRVGLSVIFAKYDAKYGAARFQKAPKPSPKGKKKTSLCTTKKRFVGMPFL
jgi:hypothetical protein